ncbi:MAG: formate/nitrite transporter family protein [Muribaculaceae bacterium]|nr:formate/nitrite transporter family protein [Roseburia sp.]MCM1430112.1 formate/nitrite transporter family protein [Muribaculaceae bacterium]MCM1492177.1 formate/nitrite transporter family protein [Muribaculaceae bacterium]
MKDIFFKSVAASLMISLGVAVLFSVGTPVGPFLFALGLLGVCTLKANLFTGKCGYLFLEHLKISELLEILLINLLSGYLFGYILSVGNPAYYAQALEKISTWSFDPAFFIRALFCGVIMFVAVEIFKRGSALGILLGIPLFIFSGFQHCIANIIVLGMGRTMDASILLCIAGNFCGSLFVAHLLNPQWEPKGKSST